MNNNIIITLEIPRDQAMRLVAEIEDALTTIRNNDAELEPVVNDTGWDDDESPVPTPFEERVESTNQAAPFPPVTLRELPWGRQAVDSYGMEFIEGLLWIESQIGLKPELLLPCMKFESNINHKARNPLSSASGLIQFMSFTARNLGTTIEAIRSMDVMTQLSYVYRYFADFEKRGFDLSKWDIADVYMAILWPAGIGKPLDHPIFVRGKGKTYAPNRGLDANKDGYVTKGEAANKIIRLEKAGYLPQNVLAI